MAHMLSKLFAFILFCSLALPAMAQVIPPATYPRPSEYDDAGPPPSIPSSKRAEFQRDSWYIGFGLGGGSGTYAENGSTGKMRGWNSTSSRDFPLRYLNFKVGKTLTSRILLGLDVTGFRSFSDTACYPTELIVTNVNLVTTLFPWKDGFFLRNGLGLSGVSHRDVVSGSHAKYDGGGNLLTGIGYAVLLGKNLHLTVNADYSQQRYFGGKHRANTSQIAAVWAGLDWY